MKIIRITLALILCHITGTDILAQRAGVANIFRDEETLPIRLSISMKEVKKSMSDSTYFPTVLHYGNPDGTFDSIRIGIRARGNFRRRHCFFPPLRIKIKKEDAAGTLFAGTKNLKLVMPCQVAKNYKDLLLKEYVCYKLYEPITPYAFSTRMVNITLTDEGGKSSKTYEVTGFLIEDDDALARRLDASVIEQAKLSPMYLQDTSAVRHDLFQYMIGNTDFSTTFLHNAKVIQTRTDQKIPIPYDFDMAGFVNAPYATFDESLGIRSVRERIYKGFCRNEMVTEFVRQEYINLESAINEVINHHESLFDPKEFEGVKKYMNAFFVVMKDDGYYKLNITQKCRER